MNIDIEFFIFELVKVFDFFFYQGFLLPTLTTHRKAGEGRGPSFIPLSTTSTCSQTFRYLVATLHVR